MTLSPKIGVSANAEIPSPQADAGEILAQLQRFEHLDTRVMRLIHEAASLIERQAAAIKTTEQSNDTWMEHCWSDWPAEFSRKVIALARKGLEGERHTIASAYAKGLEDAAKIAEDYPKRQNPDGEYVPTAAVNMCWREIAAAIRSRIPTHRGCAEVEAHKATIAKLEGENRELRLNWADDSNEAVIEIDRLKAENERLKQESNYWQMAAMHADEREEGAHAEIKRLREALQTILLSTTGGD